MSLGLEGMKFYITNMADIICKVCGKEFPSLLVLHNHIKRLENFSQKDYYEHFFKKYDLNSGKQIPYKNYSDYNSRRFIDKRGEFSYLMKMDFNDISKEILGSQLDDILGKANGRFPTYCEWRSSKNLKYDLMKRAGIFDRFFLQAKDRAGFSFDYVSPLPEIIRKESEILIDTREQKPLLEGPKTTINVGDYTLSHENYNGIHIDRKSLPDFISTFTAGLDRFKKECQKAKSLDVYLIVLVEASFSDCFRYRPLKFTRQVVTGENAFNGVRRITREFENVQFLFVKDRKEAKEYIPLLLNNKEIVKGFDLQLIYETGEFK